MTRSFWQGLGSACAALIWRARCVACLALLTPTEMVDEAFCTSCSSAVVLPGPHTLRAANNAACQTTARPDDSDAQQTLTAIHVLGHYGGPLADAILRLKHSESLWVGRQLGKKLGAIAPRDCDLVVPIPLHKRRLIDRGYNVAMELARAARISPIWNGLLRVRHTPPQSGGRAARSKNVAGAFALRSGKQAEQIQRANLLLIDDVVTTGATAAECARVLLAAGAATVTLLAVAIAAE